MKLQQTILWIGIPILILGSFSTYANESGSIDQMSEAWIQQVPELPTGVEIEYLPRSGQAGKNIDGQAHCKYSAYRIDKVGYIALGPTMKSAMT